MLPPAAVGVVTRPRLRLVDRPLVLILKDRLGPSTIRAAVRRRVPGFFFRGPPPGTRKCMPSQMLSVAQTAGSTCHRHLAGRNGSHRADPSSITGQTLRQSPGRPFVNHSMPNSFADPDATTSIPKLAAAASLPESTTSILMLDPTTSMPTAPPSAAAARAAAAAAASAASAAVSAGGGAREGRGRQAL